MKFSAWFKEHRLVVILLAVMAALLGVSLYLNFRGDPLDEFKEMEKADFPPEARKAADKAIAAVAAGDSDAFFKMMKTQDKIYFDEAYRKTIFADPEPFAPARILDEPPPQKLVRSSVEHVIVHVYSEPRKKHYSLSLHKSGNTYKVAGMFEIIKKQE